MSQPPNSAEFIKETVANSEDIHPRELPELEDWVRSDVFHQLTVPERDQDKTFEFSYLWYQITIRPSGEISITP